VWTRGMDDLFHVRSIIRADSLSSTKGIRTGSDALISMKSKTRVLT